MIEIVVDTDKATRFLTDVEKRQIPFATSLAINRTADEALAQAKRHAFSVFTFRDKRFPQFMFKHIERSNKNKLLARVGITGPKASILTRHEKGGLFTASDPFKPFYIPTAELRPTKGTAIPRNMYPKALRLMERGAPSGTLPAMGKMSRTGKPMFKGKRRTFTIPSPSGRPIGVFQRYGSGRRHIRMLWRYVDRLNVPPRLKFEETAAKVVNERFELNFDGFLQKALQTAR